MTVTGEAGEAGEAALLPFEEKARLVVELRKQGKTYREIAKALKISPRDIKRALRLEARRDEIEELKGRVGRLEERLLRVEEALAGLRGFQAEVSELRRWLEHGLNRRFRQEPCIHLVDGFCEGWVWERPVKGWDMRKTRDGYVLNVDRHRWMYALCPSFTPKSLADTIKKTRKLAEETERIVEMVLTRIGQNAHMP